jgi:hypothetical protein
MIDLPKGIAHSIHLNEHRVYYQSVAEYLDDEGAPTVTPTDREECIRTGDVWVLHWYPETPIGFYRIAAPTLERLLAIASDVRD